MAWLYSNDGFGNILRGGSIPGDIPDIPETFTREQVNRLLTVQARLGLLGAAITEIGANSIVTMEPTTGTEAPSVEASELARRGIAALLRSNTEVAAPRLKLVAQDGKIIA